jgi:hypothetical protein
MPLTTSFPSLSFHVFTIQAPEVSSTSLPGLSRPSKLALELLQMKNQSNEESKIDSSTLAHDIMISSAKSTLRTNEALPEQYSLSKPGSVDPQAFVMLGKYLMTGSISHVDTISKCLSMIKLCKLYGLCKDVLCSRIINLLKDLVNCEEVLSIIECVGDVVEVDGAQRFEPRDDFFLNYALDKAAEIFNPTTSKETILQKPLIAMILLNKIPQAYEAKLPKPEEEPVEDE